MRQGLDFPLLDDVRWAPEVGSSGGARRGRSRRRFALAHKIAEARIELMRIRALSATNDRHRLWGIQISGRSGSKRFPGSAARYKHKAQNGIRARITERILRLMFINSKRSRVMMI